MVSKYFFFFLKRKKALCKSLGTLSVNCHGSWGLLQLLSGHYLFKSPEGTLVDFCLVTSFIWLLSGTQVISGLDCWH